MTCIPLSHIYLNNDIMKPTLFKRVFRAEIILKLGIALMRYKFCFIFIIFSLYTPFVVMAESTQICSQQAIEEANSQYLREISSYISEFTNQKNQAAVAELSKIKPKASFKKKHAAEIKQFGQPDYQPSQEFCDDAYTNLKELKQQINSIIEKYNDDVEETSS